VVQNPSLCALPLEYSKGDQCHNPDNKSGDDSNVRPRPRIAAKAEAGQEQGQTGCKLRFVASLAPIPSYLAILATHQTHPREIEPAELLHKGQVVELGVSLGGSVADDDADDSNAPERHLDPLKRV
jgi:hypothetical protein